MSFVLFLIQFAHTLLDRFHPRCVSPSTNFNIQPTSAERTTCSRPPSRPDNDGDDAPPRPHTPGDDRRRAPTTRQRQR
ncbi:hypothetical protein L210DRAFT_2987072 [Boletus edulis BED1]|uniref:Secreted protein n=1 Tax=Boletus edulis BED1 TaxID=1328754 RepID=A0AAD4G4A9_BOLED|nr:hypothetical protein L210DRAFT_2987072 [Boletus edulis BED1]